MFLWILHWFEIRLKTLVFKLYQEKISLDFRKEIFQSLIFWCLCPIANWTGIWQVVGRHHGAFTRKGLPGVRTFDNVVKNRLFVPQYFVKTQACFIKHQRGISLRKERKYRERRKLESQETTGSGRCWEGIGYSWEKGKALEKNRVRSDGRSILPNGQKIMMIMMIIMIMMKKTQA